MNYISKNIQIQTGNRTNDSIRKLIKWVQSSMFKMIFQLRGDNGIYFRNKIIYILLTLKDRNNDMDYFFGL